MRRRYVDESVVVLEEECNGCVVGRLVRSFSAQLFRSHPNITDNRRARSASTAILKPFPASFNMSARPTRQGQACRHCHARKIRCDGGQSGESCSNCRAAGVACV